MGGSSTTETQTEQRNLLPDYINRGSQRAVQMAEDRTNQAYEGYGGQRIAGLSESEQIGMEGFRNEFGRYDQDFDQARGALEGIGSFTDPGVREQFMNPYIEGVLQPQVRRRDRAFGERQAELRRTSGMRGAFGGRQRVSENLLQQTQEEGLDDLYAKGYGTAFDKATALYGQEQDRQLALAGAYGDVAQGQADTNQMALRNLMESGFVDRSVEQSQLDFDFMEFIEERDWDVGNLSTLVQTLQGVPYETTTETEQTVTEQQSPIQTMIGVAALVAGGIMVGMGGGGLMAIGEGLMAAAGGLSGGG